jgi:hypothetical protein
VTDAKLLSTIYGNRSACHLLLGKAEQALADAQLAIQHNDKYVCIFNMTWLMQ